MANNDGILINALRLLGIVVSARILVFSFAKCQSAYHELGLSVSRQQEAPRRLSHALLGSV